jgi:dTDP-4-dehydrorhamnose reductase
LEVRKKNMRLLVTGATGLIGRELTCVAVSLGFDVFSGRHDSKPDFGQPVALDTRNEDSIERALDTSRPDCVIHLAAMTDVDKCESDRALAVKMNEKATELIAVGTRRCGAHLVYASSDYVFEGSKGMYREEDVPSPINWYGHTKLLGEIAVERRADGWSIVRTSTPYGFHPTKKTFAVSVAEKLTSKAGMRVVVDQYTSPTYVTDLVLMILEVARRRIEGKIHLASSTRISRYEFARLVAKSLGLDADLLTPVAAEKLGWVAERPRDSSLDVGKALSVLESKPRPVDDSLRDFAARLTQEPPYSREAKPSK